MYDRGISLARSPKTEPGTSENNPGATSKEDTPFTTDEPCTPSGLFAGLLGPLRGLTTSNTSIVPADGFTLSTVLSDLSFKTATLFAREPLRSATG